MANFVRLFEKLDGKGVASEVNDFTAYACGNTVQTMDSLVNTARVSKNRN